MKEEIKKIIQKTVKDFTKESVDFSVEVPKGGESHGDYASNIALVLAKKLNKNPLELAKEICNKISNEKDFKSIIVAGPGFINFFVADRIYIDILKSVDKNFGRGTKLKNKKVIIDYTDPNPFKEFHIGHLMSNAIGESLSRIFEFQGAKIKRVCYQGDVGMHVAKAIWGKMKDDSKSWGEAYAFGATSYEENEEAKKEMAELNKKIFSAQGGVVPGWEKTDAKIHALYDEGKKSSLKHFDEIYIKLDTRFDYFIFESQVMNIGIKIVEDGLKKGIFEKGESGAIIFKGEQYGLHTRVFINSEGLPTYEAKDLGLAEVKYKKYKYDKSIVVTANEQSDYFKVMLCAMGKVLPALAERTKHISHGMLRLPEGKMSSRTGKVITGESLIEKVEELVKEKIKDRNLSEQEGFVVVEGVAIGAIKYSVLKQLAGSDIIYDFDKSISFDGDSGPYLQYAYTRAQSVLKKAKDEGIKMSFKKTPSEITQLEKMISYFPDITIRAEKSYEPHFIALYLTELAGTFNNYYSKNKIVDKRDEFSSYRVALTNAFSLVMKNGMWLLGIKTLDRM
jgi:arginyl-tRNA synthetase